MSSPARSSASATSAVGIGDDGPYHFPPDIICAQDRKDEALSVLKSELMAALQKEVKSLDEDNWMFARPRSQIHLIARPGGFSNKLGEKLLR